MKVLFINTVCGRSSTGRILYDIDCLLRENGDESLTLFGRYDAPENMNALRTETDFGNKLHGLHARLFDRQGFASKKATKKMIAAIREYQPDIIHLHNLHGYYLNLPMLFGYLAKADIPVVWTLHDCWPYTGHCVHYDTIGCGKWKTQCHHCPQKTMYPQSLLLDSSKRNYKEKKTLLTAVKSLTVVTVSDWLKHEAEQSFLGKHSIKRIYNGIDRMVFKPTDSQIREKLGVGDRYMILGVSDGWSERKGLSYFLRLADELQPDEVIVMLGFKKEEIDRLPPGIIGLERTNSVQELAELYSAADVLINPSFEETFGLITAESLSCGTPAIVFNATACPELVDETCGRVIPKGDYAALKQTVRELRTVDLTQEACVKRSELFDKATNYRQYVDLYYSILKGECHYEQPR